MVNRSLPDAARYSANIDGATRNFALYSRVGSTLRRVPYTWTTRIVAATSPRSRASGRITNVSIAPKSHMGRGSECEAGVNYALRCLTGYLTAHSVPLHKVGVRVHYTTARLTFNAGPAQSGDAPKEVRVHALYLHRSPINTLSPCCRAEQKSHAARQPC